MSPPGAGWVIRIDELDRVSKRATFASRWRGGEPRFNPFTHTPCSVHPMPEVLDFRFSLSSDSRPSTPPIDHPKAALVMNSMFLLARFRSRLHLGALVLTALLSCAFSAALRAQTPVVQIDAGGGAVAPFVADE